jgi:hypothetical protein
MRLDVRRRGEKKPRARVRNRVEENLPLALTVVVAFI